MRPTAASNRMRAMSGMVPTICSVLATAVIMGAVQAEEIYPARPVRLVVGFGAGGPTDIPARFVAEKLGEALGQRVIVDNTAAAAGGSATPEGLGQPRARP